MRTRTTIILAIGLVMILIGLIVMYGLQNFQQTTQVRLGSGVYALRLADTEDERVLGLSGTEKLTPNGGLLMVYDSSDQHGIWMKDMNYPLDIVWLDENKEVVYVIEDAQPENPVETVYQPQKPALYVIELPAGSAATNAIKIGDVAEFNIDV